MAQYATEIGLNGFELMVDIQNKDPVRIKDIFSNQGLSIFSMTPDNVDICSLNDSHREKAIQYYESLIDYACLIDSPMITAHEFVGRTNPKDLRSLEWQRLVDSCIRITKKAERKNISVVFEPLSRNIVSSVINSQLAVELAQQVNSPNFAIVLDSFHMAKEEIETSLAIIKCQDYLKLFQIADSNRLGIGDGTTNFDIQFNTLKSIEYHHPIIIECCVDIKGPSLKEQNLVNSDILYDSISKTYEWLKNKNI